MALVNGDRRHPADGYRRAVHQQRDPVPDEIISGCGRSLVGISLVAGIIGTAAAAVAKRRHRLCDGVGYFSP